MNLTKTVLKKLHNDYAKLHKIPLKKSKSTLIMYRPSDLDKLGLTLDNVRDIYFKEEK